MRKGKKEVLHDKQKTFRLKVETLTEWKTVKRALVQLNVEIKASSAELNITV